VAQPHPRHCRAPQRTVWPWCLRFWSCAKSDPSWRRPWDRSAM